MTRKYGIIIRLGVALSTALVLAAPVAWAAVVDADLQAALNRSGPADRVSVIVRFTGRPDLGLLHGQAKALQRAGIVSALKAQSGTSVGAVEPILSDPSVSRRVELWGINGIALTANADVIRALAGRPEVARIAIDAMIEGPGLAKAGPAGAEWNLDTIRAPEMWAAGHTGAGVVVGSMDTGVDAGHPDLAAGYRGGGNSWTPTASTRLRTTAAATAPSRWESSWAGPPAEPPSGSPRMHAGSRPRSSTTQAARP